MFRGLQSLDVSIDPPGTLAPPENVPGGFDAVVQFDSSLMQRQLLANLVEAGAATLSARVLVSAGGFPEAVGAAVAPFLRPIDTVRTLETDIEVRIGAPRVRSLQVGTGPVSPGDLVLEPEFAAAALPGVDLAAGEDEEPRVEIEWLLELNLLRVFIDSQTIDPTGGAGGGGGASAGAGIHGGTTAGLGGIAVASTDAGGGPTSPPGTREVRNALATGSVITRMPSHLVTREDILQAWVELDVAQAETTISSNGSPLTELLAVQRGQDMLRSALALLTSRSGLRLSPRVSIAGNASLQQIATMHLAPMYAKTIVQTLPDDRDVLSLCFNFGGEAGSPTTQVKSFLGSNDFAYYVSVVTLVPVLRLRWNMRPAAHEFAGDVPVEMPLHDGSSETGEGRARLRLRLGGALTVSLMAVESVDGHVQDDVLRLGCDQEIQLLRLWRPDGQEIQDLGELGKPATLPFVINNQLFAKPDEDEKTDTPLRNFLDFVLEPLARPLVEPFEIVNVDGLASEALGAIVVRWSPRLRPGFGPTGVTPGAGAGVSPR